VLRRLAAAPVAVAASFAAVGWLYLSRVGLPGPRVGEALPLDQLSRHDAAPLLWFVVVWGSAALLLGLYARWARLDRVTAALVLGLCVGLFVYLETSVSVAVVQQIPLRNALDAAARMKSVYLPAVLVAVVTALLAERRSARRAPLLVATAVATGAALDLLHAILPGDDTGILRPLTPNAVGPLARAAGVLAAVALLAASRGLARRRHRAWQVAASLAGASTVLHVLHGLNDGTLASAIVLVLLVATRHAFDGPGDVTTRRRVLARTVIAAGALLAYGTVALWLNRLGADQAINARFVMQEIGRGLLGLDLRGSPHLAGSFGDWFPLSLLLTGAAGVLWVVAGWTAPWRHRVLQLERERELARTLVHAWGADTLAPFVLRADKAYFFSSDQAAFIAYRVVGGVAIVSGDPIGPTDQADALVGSFVAWARERDWRVAILGASERWLPLYARHGLHSLYHGDEAIVDTAAFSLEGRAIRKVRQSTHRLTDAGYRAEVLRPSVIGPALRSELEEVAREWRGNAPERGFVMALDALFGLGDDDALFVIGRDDAGRATGFLHFAVAPAGQALSLSSMPRLRETPNGFNEWLICEAISWAQENGYARMSLNFAPFAAVLAPEADLTRLQEVQRRALLSLKGHFQLDNLLAFNGKFFPTWERRFVVFERRRDLPRVGIAALAAEAYLPFQTERK
jgi:lysyl-tRNA synthetase, class II